ncbi:MAG: FHA domain-containing protein [Chloroflexota bacterium]
MITLDQIEARIRELIEVRLPGILPGRRMEAAVFQQFAAAINANILEKDGIKFAPNHYTLTSSPEEAESWQDARLLDALKDSIHSAGRDAGLEFETQPTLTITADSGILAGEARVTASHRAETLGPTDSVVREEARDPEETHVPDNAFLIVDGRKVFPLKLPVINIGRRLENQLVIDDPRISRSHSQLRAIKGRYVIFDLNSTGGTFVNGQRTSQTVLYPGDVISLAGVTLVFGQDNPPPRPDLKETGPLSQQAADRPTAILKDRTDIRKKKK